MAAMTDRRSEAASFRAARDLLLRHRADYDAARAEFSWPELDEFNWALDWFDVIAAEHPDRTALRIVTSPGGGGPNGEHGTRISYRQMSRRSDQVANWLRDVGVQRGDRLLLMLGNIAPLWEVILATMKLGAVIVPTSTLLGPSDLADRIERGDVRHVVTESAHVPKFREVPGDWTRIAVEPTVGGAIAEASVANGAGRGQGANGAQGTPVPASGPGAAPGPGAWLAYADSYGAEHRVCPGRGDPGHRPAAAVLHLRHHRPAQAGPAHSRFLPGRAPVDHVLDRAPARRRAPEHLLAGLGQARLEQRVRALERGRDRTDLWL